MRSCNHYLVMHTNGSRLIASVLSLNLFCTAMKQCGNALQANVAKSVQSILFVAISASEQNLGISSHVLNISMT